MAATGRMHSVQAIADEVRADKLMFHVPGNLETPKHGGFPKLGAPFWGSP